MKLFPQDRQARRKRNQAGFGGILAVGGSLLATFGAGAWATAGVVIGAVGAVTSGVNAATGGAISKGIMGSPSPGYNPDTQNHAIAVSEKIHKGQAWAQNGAGEATWFNPVGSQVQVGDHVMYIGANGLAQTTPPDATAVANFQALTAPVTAIPTVPLQAPASAPAPAVASAPATQSFLPEYIAIGIGVAAVGLFLHRKGK